MANQLSPCFDKRSGFDSRTGVYQSLFRLDEHLKIPTEHDLDVATFVLSQFPSPQEADAKVALVDSATNRHLTYAQLRRSVTTLASGLYHGLGVRKGDVIIILSPNSLLYPVICLAVLSIGAVITTANPLNTETEVAKQVLDSGAKLAISSPEEAHKLQMIGLPILLTTRCVEDNQLSVEELIESYGPLQIQEKKPTQSDTAAILYSSGTTGTSKGVVLTHSNFISIARLLKWTVVMSKAQEDIFISFIPMFHIYGLAFFALGLFCSGVTTVVMQKYDLQGMLEAIQKHKVSNIPGVPPVILGLVKHNGGGYDLSSLRRVGSGAAPLSKEVADGFRKKFPGVEIGQGYGLTETSAACSVSVSDEEEKARPASSGRLVPCFSAKVVDVQTGLALPPYAEGELWLKSPTVMKEYLGNDAATAATFDSEGWLKTGDLCYFDGEGYLYIIAEKY